MALQSGFFRSIGGDRRYNAEFFASYFSSFIGNGVFPNPSTGLQVITGGNLDVNVQPGKGWINGYYLVNTDNYTLTLDQADGALSRVDRVVMGWNAETRLIDIYLKKGVSSNNPVAPTLQRDATVYELALADIRLNNGVIAVSQSAITDQRFNSSLCGIVASTINQIDTTNLFAQYNSSFEQFLNQLQDVLDENAAANLLNLINGLDERVQPLELLPTMLGAPNGIAQLNSEGFLDYSQFNNVIVGTYTGNGSPSQTINLGFRPRAVFIMGRSGQINTSTNITYWGFAVDGSNATSYNMANNTITIENQGFAVYFVNNASTPTASVGTNTNAANFNPFRYIAFR